MMRSRALPEHFDATQTLHSPLHDASRAAMMSPIHRGSGYPDVGREGPLSPRFQPSPAMSSMYGPSTPYRPADLSPASPHAAYAQSSMAHSSGQQPSAGVADVRMAYYSPQPTSHPSLRLYTGSVPMGPTSAPGGATGTSTPNHVGYATYPGSPYQSPGGTPIQPSVSRQRVVSHHGSVHGSQPGSPTHMVMGPQGGYSAGPWSPQS
jgi:hypothetical protein